MLFFFLTSGSNLNHLLESIHILLLVPSDTWLDFCALGGPRGWKKIKHGYVAYLIDVDDEPSRMQVKFSS